MHIGCVAEAGNILGESPVWDSDAQCLRWIDIHGRTLHSYDPVSRSVNCVRLPEQVGSIGLRERGGLIAATRIGFSFLDPETGAMEPIVDPLRGAVDVRFNDGRCDRSGRFWAGTVQERRVVGGAALFRLDAEQVCTCMVENVTVSNGLAWSPDDRILYFSDSHAREIYAFDFHLETGTLGERRLFARFPDEFGMPDGATVDREGSLWSAGIGGWHVLKFTPDGHLDEAIRMPVSQPTSCTFGGPGLDILYVTSASMRLDDEARDAQPLAGGVFALEVGTTGFSEPKFKG